MTATFALTIAPEETRRFEQAARRIPTLKPGILVILVAFVVSEIVQRLAPHVPIPHWSDVPFLTMMGAMVVELPGALRPRLDPFRHGDFTIDPDGVFFTGDASIAIAWHDIARVDVAAGAFLIVRRRRSLLRAPLPILAVPMRLFGDDGDALADMFTAHGVRVVA